MDLLSNFSLFALFSNVFLSTGFFGFGVVEADFFWFFLTELEEETFSFDLILLFSGSFETTFDLVVIFFWFF